MSRHIILRGCAAVALLWAAASALAQGFPTRPITVLVPFAAGGTVDIVTRALSPHLAQELGQPVVVDNRGGAGGTLASAMLARAPADGHTIMVHHMGIAFNASLYERLPYDTLKDIAPLAHPGATPNVLVVTNAFPAKTLQDFLAEARAKPGTINYGSGGVGSAGHLPMELLQSMTGVKLVHVPYKGSGPALTDLISGQIQTMLLTIPAVMSHISSGRVRAIATSGAQRTPALAHLPTLDEAGVKGFNYSPWYGAFGPAGVPAPVLARLHAAFNKAISNPEIRTRLAQQGLEVQELTRAQFVDMVHADTEKWARIVKSLGIRVADG